ncbi:AraC family transcriptional regulator [Metabacillus herbersteinensis]|uniref:AraC family transcriptional regulator n=1 Tax=Metabacillus herbersteinensis TaxID=283816 RepID=A0ABV6GMB3_9BACI
MREYGHEFAEHWFYTPTLIERSGGLNIIRAGQNLAKKNYHIGPRFISYFSIHCILSGSGTYINEGKQHSIKSGDVFFLFANHTHSYYTSQQELLEMFWIAFDGRQARPMLSKLGITEESTCVHEILTTKIRKTTEDLIILFKEYDENKQFKKISLIYELFDNLYEEISKKNIPKPKKKNDWIQNGIDYIEMYYSEGITVADIAEYVGINRTHFSNMFTKRVGTSPYSYLQRKIMNRAVELLSTTQNSITEIALSLCFSDVYSFSRSFKNYYGMSPTDFRDTNKETNIDIK